MSGGEVNAAKKHFEEKRPDLGRNMSSRSRSGSFLLLRRNRDSSQFSNYQGVCATK